AYWLSDTYYNLGRYEDAEKGYDGFIKTNPASPLVPEARYGLAWTYDKLGRTAEAAVLFRKLAEEYPGGPHAPDSWYKAGEYSYKSKDYEDVVAAFENYLRLSPPGGLYADANYQMGVALSELGRADAAVSAFSAVEDAGGPLAAPAALKAAGLLEKGGRGEDAIGHYQTAATDEGYKGEALLGKGRTLLGMGRYGDALTALKSSLELPAETAARAEAYCLSGDAGFGQASYKDAIIDYTKCQVAGDPMFAGRALAGIAACYDALGEKEKALGAYRKYMETYPDGDKAGEAGAALKRLGG
ncbi:MAG TPA: tetratricopeptide repeat protein, partial [Nitrospirota bacterium]